MGMKHSGICQSAHVDPSLAYLIQSSLLQANQDSTEEWKEAVSGSDISSIFFPMDVQYKLKWFGITKAG